MITFQFIDYTKVRNFALNIQEANNKEGDSTSAE